MLTVAVMAILITAPLGAILIMLTGPRLLARDVPEEGEEVHEHEMQTMPETELDQSPLSLARFKAAQHHGSQQLIKARRYSCLWLIMCCWRNYIFSLPIINFASSSLRNSMLLALICREPQDLIGFFGARVLKLLFSLWAPHWSWGNWILCLCVLPSAPSCGVNYTSHVTRNQQ